jgi:hypothetical protein
VFWMGVWLRMGGLGVEEGMGCEEGRAGGGGWGGEGGGLRR